MPKPVPDVAAKFAIDSRKSLDVAAATETLWLTAPPTSEVRKQLKVGQLEALYEAVYLRIFAAWETALEDLVVYYLAGYRTATYIPQFVGVRPKATLTAARTALYGSNDYVLWHNPSRVAKRTARYLVNCPVELVARSAAQEIERYSAVRHAIAHASADAQVKFRAAAVAISGYNHASVGRFLRSEDLSDALNPSKRILVIRNRLVDLVALMRT